MGCQWGCWFFSQRGGYTLLFVFGNIVPLPMKFFFLFLMFGFQPVVGAVLFSVAGTCLALCCVSCLDLSMLVMSYWSFSSLINFNYHKKPFQKKKKKKIIRKSALLDVSQFMTILRETSVSLISVECFFFKFFLFNLI